MARLRYRVWQFWRVLWDRPDQAGLAAAQQQLSPDLFALFLKMSPAEQAHALRVFNFVIMRGYSHHALLEAALLHDIGKIRCRLLPWERAWVVLANFFLPERAAAWGRGEARGLGRAFVVAARHAEWGAELAAAAGAGDVTVRLVHAHQSASPVGFTEEEAQLLGVLMQADNRN